MTQQEAVKILRQHNEWRRYDGPVGEGPEMVNPTELGVAIDIVCDALAPQRSTGNHLTLFQRRVRFVMSEVEDGRYSSDNIDDVKAIAKGLLDVASEEQMYQAGKKFAEIMLEKLDAYSKEDAVKGAYEEGKKVAQQVRWKKWEKGACGGGSRPIAIIRYGTSSYSLVSSLGIIGEEYILLSDLEKLPKK